MKFYFNGSPNPTKVALFLEEAGIVYEPVPVDVRKGDQFDAAFLKINPNAKVPALVDGATTVFDSNAILLYLGEKTGKFMPAAAARGDMLSWLMFIATGIGPFSGQAVHFKHFAPKDKDHTYANERYQFEAMRHYKIIDEHLAKNKYMVGGAYSIVDMALWGWARMIAFILGEDAWKQLPNLKRHHDEITARPAAIRAVALKDKFTFKTDMDADARRNMFRHIKGAA
jgi:GSH-dependent disulfide-bond oxidoreductase